MTEVTCKVIPLYRVRIIFDPKEKDDTYYEEHIIADHIDGLIKGIVNIELEREIDLKLEKRRMTYDIVDFLLMPCKDARGRGYHLFDIEGVDSAPWYNGMIDCTTYYNLYFSREQHPSPSLRDFDKSTFAEPVPVRGAQSRHGMELSEMQRSIEYEEDIMEAIYNLARTGEYRQQRMSSEYKEKRERMTRAIEGVEKWRKEENTYAETMTFLENMLKGMEPEPPFEPNYGKHPERWLTPLLRIVGEDDDPASTLSDYVDVTLG
jgi:hypothetical protein